MAPLPLESSLPVEISQTGEISRALEVPSLDVISLPVEDSPSFEIPSTDRFSLPVEIAPAVDFPVMEMPLMDAPVTEVTVVELPGIEVPIADVPMVQERPTSVIALAAETVTSAPMNQLHLIGGEKGGVGKSVMSRVFAQYCIDRGIPFQGFDSDRSHGSFRRFYEGFTQKVELEDFQSLDQLAEFALGGGDDVQLIVDLAAQSSTSLRTWMEDTGVLELFHEAGVIVNCWHILDDGRDSLSMLGRLLAEFKGDARYVVVLNHGRGARFDAFHASPEKVRALELGARIIELPKLHEGTMRQVDHSNSSFWAAINAGEDGNKLLGILDRQRVKMWLRKVYSELDGLGLRRGNV